MYANVRSLRSKVPELRSRVMLHDPDIILICETWLTSSLPDSFITIPNYEIIVRRDGEDTTDGKGRGLLIYCKTYLNAIPIENKLIDDIVQCAGIEIKFNKNYETPTSLYLFYRPPRPAFSPEDNNNTAKICEAFSKLPDDCLAIGDLNFPSIDWGRSYSTSSGEKVFLDAVKDRFLTQHTEEPTHIAGNLIDLVFSDRPNNINSVEVVAPLGNSDHNMLLVEYTSKIINEEEAKMIPNWHKLNIEKIQEGFMGVDWKTELGQKNANECWELIKGKLDTLIQENLPMKKRKSTSRPVWMNHKIVKLMRKKERYFKQAKKGNHEAQNKLRQVTKELKYAIRRSKKNYEDSLAADKNYNPKRYYGYINGITKNKESVGPLKNAENKLLSEDVEMAEELNKFFCSVFSVEDTSSIPDAEQTYNGDDPLTDTNITAKIVEEKIKKMKPNGAPGPLTHWPKIVSQLKTQISYPLSILFNKCLQESVCPDDWKEANITPLFKKKGKKSMASNYRPVALTSILGKLMESCLKDQITRHLDDHNLLRDTQHGFRQGHSVLSNLINHLDTLTKLIDSGVPVDVLYLDFAKAFDVIPHRRLLAKCAGMGIRGKLLKWIESWLIGRRQRVVINGKASSWLEVTSGVPQGSILGPLLFLIYINDIDTVLINNSGYLSKFADDTKVMFPLDGQSSQQSNGLQEIIKRLESWSQKWLMRFNTQKCTIMHFGSTNPNLKYYMNGDQIKESEAERDIGVIISSNMKPSVMCATVAKKANKLLGLLSRGLSFKTKKNFLPLYKQYVLPHLEFAQISWAPWLTGDQELLESVQKRALRQITNLKGKSYSERLEECDLLSINDRRRRNDLIYLYKVLHNYEGVDCKKMFDFAQREEDLIATRHSSSYMSIIPKQSRRDSRQYFWSSRVIGPWNSLPDSIRSQPTIGSFKASLDLYIKSSEW